jgi:glycosyltransferase involved in cell wall biosynthesis
LNRIIISATNDLTTDQRIKKTSDCFNELGYDILLIGRSIKNGLPLHSPYKTCRFRLLFNKGFLFYAEYNLRLFLKLLFLKKSLLLSNDLDTLLPNFLISKIHSNKLIYDSHEYFTEVPELISRPKVKSVWLWIEKFIFPKLKNVITVNETLAEFYHKKYGVPVAVIKNVPDSQANIDPEEFNFSKPGERIILYQGALNMGRGLELMIDSMKYLENYLFVIIGDGDLRDDLKKKVLKTGLRDKIIFLGKILPEKLPGFTMNADLGISLEEDIGLSYRYALPNKIFDYMQAGVPVLASDLPLYNQLFSEFPIGEILKTRNPESVARTVDHILTNRKTYQPALKKASLVYNWDHEKLKLIEFIKNLE